MNSGKIVLAAALAFALGIVLGGARPRAGPEPYQSRLMPGDTIEVHWPREVVDAPTHVTADGKPGKLPVVARCNLFVYKTDADPDLGEPYPPDGRTWWMMTLPGGQRVWLAEDLSKRTTE